MLTGANLAAAALAAGLLGISWRRCAGTRLLQPLLLLFATVSATASLEALAYGAFEMGMAPEALALSKASTVSVALSLSALFHFTMLYPRVVRGRLAAGAVLGLYAVAGATALLAATPSVIAGVEPGRFRFEPVYGPLYGVLEAPMLLSTMAVAGWGLYLSRRGRDLKERRAGRVLLLAVGVPVLAALLLYAPGVPPGWAGLSTPFGNAWYTALLFTALLKGHMPMGAPATLQAVLGAIGDPVLVADRSGNILRANRAAAELFGASEDRLAGRPVDQAMAAAAADPAFAGYARVAMMGVLRRRIEEVSDGVWTLGAARRRWRLRMRPVVADAYSGEPTSLLVILEDVTDRERLEAAQRRLTDLQDLVIRVLGHDLKTPLTVVQGYADLDASRLRGSPGPDAVAAVAKDLDRIGEAALSMAAIMSNARAIAAITRGGEGQLPRRPTDLSAIVGQTVRSYLAAAGARGVSLVSQVEPQVVAPLVPGFESVVKNLVDNAVKYTPAGGEVRVKLTGGDHVRMEVMDTGPGVPPQRRQNLFRSFERLGAEGSKVEGHGLGLTIVASFVEFSGGRVFVEDRPDGARGALFVVELGSLEPASPDDRALPAPSGPTPVPRAAARATSSSQAGS